MRQTKLSSCPLITLKPSHLTGSLVCDAAHDPMDPLHPDLELHGSPGEAGVLSGHWSLLTVLWWLLPV